MTPMLNMMLAHTLRTALLMLDKDKSLKDNDPSISNAHKLGVELENPALAIVAAVQSGNIRIFIATTI